MSIVTIIKYISANNYRLLFEGVVGISVLSLAVAYFAEYVMHLAPCPLCLYQRVPFAAMIILGAIGCYTHKVKLIMAELVIVLVAACILAAYHTGIERKWWEASLLCSNKVQSSDSLSVEEYTDMLYAAPIATCSKPALTVLGLSMTEWNLLLNIVLLAIVSITFFSELNRYHNSNDAKRIRSQSS